MSVRRTLAVGAGIAAVIGLAVTGSAVADNGAHHAPITSAEIKDGAVHSPDIADGGVRSPDLRDGGVRKADLSDWVKGQIGVPGPQGPEGPAGAEGPPGPQGPSCPEGSELTGPHQVRTGAAGELATIVDAFLCTEVVATQ